MVRGSGAAGGRLRRGGDGDGMVAMAVAARARAAAAAAAAAAVTYSPYGLPPRLVLGELKTRPHHPTAGAVV